MEVSAKVVADLRAKLAYVPEATIVLSETAMGGGNEAPIQVVLYGDDLERLRQLSGALAGKIRTVKDVTDVDSTLKEGRPELRIPLPDEQVLRQWVALAGDAIGALLGRQPATTPDTER